MQAEKKKYAGKKFYPRKPRYSYQPYSTPKNSQKYLKTTSSIGPDPFPTEKFVKLKYSMTTTLTQVSVPVAQQFRCNSLYDPDLTGTGHQPYFYDQLNTIYQNYTVYGVAYEIIATANVSTQMVVRATTLATAPTSLELESERPNSVTKLYSPGGSPAYFSGYISNRKIAGVTKEKLMSENDYSALVGANPSYGLYLNFLTGATNFGVDTTVTLLTVKLVYYAKMWNRSAVGQS